MAKKKTEDAVETVETAEEATTSEVAVEMAAADEVAETAVEAAAETAVVESPAAEEPKKPAAKRSAAKATAEPEAEAAGDGSGKAKKGKRAEKIGVVASDKMTKTVVVRVDRVVKHPTYRKYVRRRKKFMAHDETGAKIGDKVRIVETRPLSARKRWRVVEIIQKAEL